jgi:hypothetical protein
MSFPSPVVGIEGRGVTVDLYVPVPSFHRFRIREHFNTLSPMNKKYRVVFLGLIEREEDFTSRMSRLGVSSEAVQQIIQRAPIVLKRNMTLGDAREYADAIQYAGGRVNIQEHGFFEKPDRINRLFDIKPLENFTMCPRCGYKQLKEKACVKCGFLLPPFP